MRSIKEIRHAILQGIAVDLPELLDWAERAREHLKDCGCRPGEHLAQGDDFSCCKIAKLLRELPE